MFYLGDEAWKSRRVRWLEEVELEIRWGYDDERCLLYAFWARKPFDLCPSVERGRKTSFTGGEYHTVCRCSRLPDRQGMLKYNPLEVATISNALLNVKFSSDIPVNALWIKTSSVQSEQKNPSPKHAHPNCFFFSIRKQLLVNELHENTQAPFIFWGSKFMDNQSENNMQGRLG